MSTANANHPHQRWTRQLLRGSALLSRPSTLKLVSLPLASGASLRLTFGDALCLAFPPPPPSQPPPPLPTSPLLPTSPPPPNLPPLPTFPPPPNLPPSPLPPSPSHPPPLPTSPPPNLPPPSPLPPNEATGSHCLPHLRLQLLKHLQNTLHRLGSL